MADTLKLPALGENIEGGDVVKVLVKPGQTIAKDQPLLELETGKATLEVPSPFDGVIETLLVKEGDAIKIGDALLTYRQGEAGAATSPVPEAAPVAEKKAPAPAPVQAAPAVTTAPAPSAAAPDEPIKPAPTRPTPAPVPAAAPTEKPAKADKPVAAAPSVRRFAREIGIAIEDVAGSGKDGRIDIEDVKRYAKQINTGRPIASHCLLAAEPLPDFSQWGPVQKDGMKAIRLATAEHMARCWATIPHVTQHDKADITQLEALRKRFAPRVEAVGGKLTVTAILLKIVAAALKVHPKFNASLDMKNREVLFKKYIHLGLAVDTERGLLVPVLRDVDKKNITQLSVEMGEVAERARKGKVTPADLQGGTFTVTNLGGIGGSFFTPIVNAPEVAILGVGRAEWEPYCGPDGVCAAPRKRMPLSLSYDHRLIDGADGARFLRWIVEAIEEPMLISLEG